MNIGRTIRELRSQKRWTLQELANRADIDTGNLSRLERDVQKCSPELLERLAKALDISVGEIYLISEAKESNKKPLSAMMDIGRFGKAIATPKADLYKGLIPLIDWKHAAQWEITRKSIKEADILGWYPTSADLSPFAFVLRLKDDSMTNQSGLPTFPDQCLMFFDVINKEEGPQSGSFVLALNEGAKEPIFTQYIVRGNEKSLKPLNPRYPITIMDETWEIIAIAIRGMLETNPKR